MQTISINYIADMNQKFADFHCHPHVRSFNYFRNSPIEGTAHYHPWNIVVSNINNADEGKRGSSYSEADLVKLTNGNARLIFVSFHPIGLVY